MDDYIPQLIALLEQTGFVQVTCQRTYDQPRVEIDTLAGLQINIDYATYEAIREKAGLPEDVCNEENTSG